MSSHKSRRFFILSKDQTIGDDTGNIKLSSKQSMSLTDITLLSQDPNVSVFILL